MSSLFLDRGLWQGLIPCHNEQLTYTVLSAFTRGAHRDRQSHVQHIDRADSFEGNRTPLLFLHGLAGNIFPNNIF